MLWSSASFVISVSGFDHLATSMPNPQKVVTVFGSSRPRAGDADYQQARELGHALAGRGFIVCTGGYGGVMEGASRGAKEAGGRVLAVTAAFFSARANAWVDERSEERRVGKEG